MVSWNFYCYKFSPAGLLCFLALCHLLIDFDKSILSSVLILLKSDSDGGLGLTATEAGSLGSAFIVGFMIGAPFYAHLTQYFHPIWLILIGMTIFTFASFLAGFSYTFWMLLIARLISGFGESAINSIAPFLIQDAAPKGKDSQWVSIYMACAPIGIAIGGVIGYQIASALGDWRYPFIFQGLILILIVASGWFCYKNPDLIVKKQTGDGQQLLNLSQQEILSTPATQLEEEKHESFCAQLKLILSNSLFLFLALGYASRDFMFAGFGFWGLDFVEEYYGTPPQTAGIAFGAIAFVSGIVFVFLGGLIVGRLLKPYVLEREEDKITEEKLTWYKTEYSSRVLFWSIFLCSAFLIVAALTSSFISFIMFWALGVCILAMTAGVLIFAIMASVQEHLRWQAMAVAQWIRRLCGEVWAPFVFGVLGQYEGYRFAVLFAFCWLFWGVLAWWLARTVSRTHGASLMASLKVAFKKNPRQIN